MIWFLNILTARIAIGLVVLLSVIYLLRVWKPEQPGMLQKMFRAANRFLRKFHIPMGILLIAFGWLHGFLSSKPVLSWNLGTYAWIISILLGLNFMFRRWQKSPGWMVYHRALCVMMVVTCFYHLAEVSFFSGEMFRDLSTSVAEERTDITGEQDWNSLFASGSQDSSTPVRTAAPEKPADREGAVQTPATESRAPSPTPLPAQGNTASGNVQTPQPTVPVSPKITPVPTKSPAATPSPTPAATVSRWKDGTYQGTGTGFRPGLKVEVVVVGGIITQVTVVSHNEVNQRFWGVPVVEIPKRIVAAQSASVSAISGATYTSRGIMEAVRNALAQAER